MKPRQIAIYTAAGLALFLGGLIVYDSQLSFDLDGRDSFLSFSVESPYSAKIAGMLLVPGSSQEQAEWLVRAKNEPDQAASEHQRGRAR